MNVDVFANDLLNEAVKNFRLTATTDCLAISCLTTTNCRRSKNTIIICTAFSYFFISSATFFNFNKLRQLLYFDSYSRQRIKYFDSRFFVWRLLSKRFIFYNLIFFVFSSTWTKLDCFERERRKKFFDEKIVDFNWVMNKIEWIR